MVGNLQMVIHTPLINVQFPANAFLVYSVMIQVATFDFLPTDDIYPIFFTELPEDSPFTDKFDRMNIGSRYLVMNMGTMFLIFTFYAVLYVLYPFFFCCARNFKFKRCKACRKKTKPWLFYNHTIVFVQEGFLDFLIGAAINLIML